MVAEVQPSRHDDHVHLLIPAANTCSCSAHVPGSGEYLAINLDTAGSTTNGTRNRNIMNDRSAVVPKHRLTLGLMRWQKPSSAGSPSNLEPSSWLACRLRIFFISSSVTISVMILLDSLVKNRKKKTKKKQKSYLLCCLNSVCIDYSVGIV